ncbi:hypothetical protein PR202_ga18536 [Eleusine coracana subsp. coracana]|uniref:KIB1-4 beta-propeller domain-containing protein n=1 Tax=Eleusine coracana subsp. coracana TaxID=191504 RepID=A0AAV5CTG0_ELECO|nr:hypothetical protein QOZ80_4AG0298990 [Eleusine coracana subsp. coracana]GJN01283.1 hypothetical protein PR202_ga18536 [Eleusine coracana subsp. coracana]
MEVWPAVWTVTSDVSPRSSAVPRLQPREVLGEPILYSLSEKKAVPCDIDELKGRTTWATPHGWFLVHHPPPGATTFLWNPNNGDKIQLPPLPAANVSSNCTCLLSDKPGSSFVVLLLDDTGPVLWYHHCSNNNGWARHEYDVGTQILYPDDTQQEKLVITPVAACGGKVYFSTSFDELGVIDFSFSTEEEPVAFSSMAMAEVVADGYGVADSARVFMVESEGDVYMVNLLDDGRGISPSPAVYDVTVYRMDFSRRPWVRVHDLGGRAFLMSSLNFAASRPAESCDMEKDCVYMWYPWEKSMCIYNVREGTMKMEKLDGAPRTSRAFWMLPTDDL